MPIDSQLVAQGMERHRAGQYNEAHDIYRQLLAAEPQNATVLNLLGAVCINLGQTRQAAQYLTESLRLSPNFSGAHDNWGVLMMTQNRFVEAIMAFRQAVALEPQNVQTQMNLANALSMNGQLMEACEAYRRVVELKPDSTRARMELARLLFENHRTDEAIAHFREVIRVAPGDAKAHFLLADALAQTGRPKEAIASYLNVLKVQPESAEARVNLAYLYMQLKQYDEAVAHSRRAIELRPRFAEAYHNLGAVLTKQEKYEEAIEVLRKAAELKPNMPECYNNIGIALAEQGQLTDAVDHYQRSLALRSENPDALYNLGNAHLKLGNLEMALVHFNRAIELKPDYAEAHHNRSAAWLLEGDFERGLPEYEWRLRSRDYPPFKLKWPLWQNEPLEGKTIVLCAEQGLGDTLQFIRYAPLLKAAGATVIAGTLAKLHPLLKRTPGIDRLISIEPAPVPADFCVPMMSLPGRLRTTRATIPTTIPYLLTDAALVEKWRAWLDGFEGFKVGINWQGNPECPGDRTRSIPLKHLAPLAQVPGVRLVSLQMGHGSEQLDAFREAWSVIDLPEGVDKEAGAFMDTAAIVQGLDLVITSDTAAAHLAGALGTPVWVALQKVPDWRWMIEGNDNPWYPTMRVFRQKALGAWPEVFEEIAEELRRTAAARE